MDTELVSTKRRMSPPWARKVPIGRNGMMINPITDYLTKQLSDQTRISYLSVLRSFVIDWLHSPTAFHSPESLLGVLSAVQLSDAATYRDTLLQSCQPATVAKKMSILSGIYEHIKEAGLLPQGRNPFNIPRPKVSNEGKTPGFSRYEAELVLSQPDLATRQGFRDYVMLLAAGAENWATGGCSGQVK